MTSTKTATDHDATSPLVKVLDTKTHVRLVDALLERHYLQLSAADLAEAVDVDESDVDRYIDDLLAYDIVTEVGADTRPTHYQLNKGDEAVDSLLDAREALITRTESDPVENEREGAGLENDEGC